MLIPYDPFDNYFPGYEKEEVLPYFSDILAEELELPTEVLSEAITRAMTTCAYLDIPVKKNFRVSFISKGHEVRKSWELSHLACYLTIINCPPSNPLIARAQLFFVGENFQKHDGNNDY